MQPIDSVTFVEASSGEECYVGVRADSEEVALVVSRATEGDVEVLLDHTTARRIARALERGSAMAQ
jgi:hypothetical protein